MKYSIYDIRGGLLADNKEVEASSPIQAVRKFYDNVKRDNYGDIVVRCWNRSYVYSGELKKND